MKKGTYTTGQVSQMCTCTMDFRGSRAKSWIWFPGNTFALRNLPQNEQLIPEKWMLQDHPFPFGMSHFHGRTVKLQGLISTKLWECRLAPSLQYGGPIPQNTYIHISLIQGIMQQSLVIPEGHCSDDTHYHVYRVLFPSRNPWIAWHVNNPVTKHHMATTNNFGSFWK